MVNLAINTSSSLFFTKVGLIPYLLKNFRLITSEEIFNEIKEGKEIGFKDAQIIMQYLDDEKINIIKAKKTKNVEAEFSIKKTDASIISLAQELDCFLATEDRQIEKICLIMQIKIMNTALLIYFLWQNNQFNDNQAFLLLDLLIKNGYNKEICLKIKEKIIQGMKNV